jgi:hypothetical protein
MLEVTELQDGGVLVEGTDVKGVDGRTVLYSPAWQEVLAYREQVAAMEEYDAEVEKFFAPLVKAAEKVTTGSENPWATVTVGEDVEGVEAQQFKLDSAGIVLRLLAETDGSSLRWVNDTLVAIK